MIDPSEASEEAGALVRKIGETLGRGWAEKIPGPKQIAVDAVGRVVIVTLDGGLYLDGGRLHFFHSRGGRWIAGPWQGEREDYRMGSLGDPAMN